MVSPLYPTPTFKKKTTEKKEKTAPLWKNPNIMVAASIIVVLTVLFFFHKSGFGKKIDPTAGPAGSSGKGFSLSSKYFESGETKDLSQIQQEKLERMGIKAESSEVLSKKLAAKDFREERRLMAISKYEAIREQADRRMREQDEKRKRYETGTSSQLKEAVMSLEDSDLLGIMRLERLLEEKLLSKGAESQDLEALVFAYTQLAKTYEKKQMQDKAKDAYINAFKLMKKQAPETQGPDWDNAIRNVEQMNAKSSR